MQVWKVLVEPSMLLESNLPALVEPLAFFEPILRASGISDAFQILRQVKTSMEDERECDFDYLNQPGGLSWL